MVFFVITAFQQTQTSIILIFFVNLYLSYSITINNQSTTTTTTKTTKSKPQTHQSKTNELKKVIDKQEHQITEMKHVCKEMQTKLTNIENNETEIVDLIHQNNVLNDKNIQNEISMHENEKILLRTKQLLESKECQVSRMQSENNSIMTELETEKTKHRSKIRALEKRNVFDIDAMKKKVRLYERKEIDILEINNSLNYRIGELEEELLSRYVQKTTNANIVVTIVVILFISWFLFYCLFSTHSFPTNPNSIILTAF